MRQGRADRLTEDDRRRFEELFLPHLDAAYNLARWIVQHDQDARDVVQNAYVRAFKGFQHFSGGGEKQSLVSDDCSKCGLRLDQKTCPGRKTNPVR